MEHPSSLWRGTAQGSSGPSVPTFEVVKVKFSEFCDLCSSYRANPSAVQELTRKLADMFSSASATEARHLAYLCTGRIGAPYAPRDPYKSTTAQRLYDRLQRGRTHDPEVSGNKVSVSDVYLTLHSMDPIRPGWYPNTPNTAHQLFHLAGLMDEYELGWLVSLMMGHEFLADRLVVSSLVRAAHGDEDGAVGDQQDKKVVDDIVARYNKSTPDIGLVAECLRQTDIDGGLRELGCVHYGIPIPLEEMGSHFGKDQIAEAFSRFDSDEVFVQAKSDGIYLQLQKDGDNVWLFNEQGLDLASFLPRSDSASGPERTIKPRDASESRIADRVSEIVQLLTSIPVQRVVLDAELVGIDVGAGNVVRRADIFDAAGFQLIVFDIVATDRDLRTKPYTERHEMMLGLLGSTSPADRPGVYMAEERSAHSSFEALRQFEQFTCMGRYEGVVLKGPRSRLSSTFRWTQSRVKIKNYVTLDMLLVGCYYNSAKRKPTQYLGALRDPADDRFLPCVIAVATHDTGRKLEREINKYCEDTRSSACPSAVERDGDPTWWTDASLVVEVESDGLIERSDDPRFQSIEWTLHQNGQRAIVAIRRDKLRNRVNTIDRLLSLARAPGC